MGQLIHSLTSAAHARAVFAALTREAQAGDIDLGGIALQPHQRSAVGRLRAAIAEFGGAMLCDPVGTGKTFVALALIRQDEGAIVVAPAVLKPMWLHASSIAGRRIQFVSFESLSRRVTPHASEPLLIIDEAHHARNPRTVRYEMLSGLCFSREVLMLTATPIHNHRKDLYSLLALFLGSHASTMSSADIARCVIRRSQLTASLPAIPVADEVTWCRVPDDDRIVSLLLDLPPPLPPRDGGDGGALVAHSLVRQWASSNAALAGGLRRRLMKAEALIAALEDGTWPSRSELLSWLAGEESIQLSFSVLLAETAAETHHCLQVVRKHRDALRAVLDAAGGGDTDKDRASIIRRIRGSHCDRRIVVFTHYADTVERMFTLLSADGQVAALTGSGGWVAGGSLSRKEVMERFAPAASGVAPARRAEDVTMLITTDLLSEGVNLQDAGVIIHMDMPWTPARLEQRLGRIARLGSMHERVMSYAFTPPASADAVTRIELILRRKLRAAGVVTESLASFGVWSSGIDTDENSPLNDEALRSAIQSWSAPGLVHDRRVAVFSAVEASQSGFLAVFSERHRIRLAACIADLIAQDAAFIVRAASICAGADSKCTIEDFTGPGLKLHDWVQLHTSIGDHQVSAGGSTRKKVVRRLDGIVRKARTHERQRLHDTTLAVRHAMNENFGLFAEERLETLCRLTDSDEVWLDRVKEIAGSIVSRKRLQQAREDYELLAMIIFRRCPESCAATDAEVTAHDVRQN